MKKLFVVLLSFMLVTVVFMGCKKTTTPLGTGTTGTKFHIGVVTGTVSQDEDEFQGGQRLVKEYGDVANGGMITTLTYPDNFISEQETTISEIVGLADDPLMKAIVMTQAVTGCAEGFKRVRAERPDILLFAGFPQEDANVIGPVADEVVGPDQIARGYLIIWEAKQMGAKTFVHISFPRHMSIELISRRRYIMEEACKDLGLKFVLETAPDPLSDVGVAGAQQFILEKTPAWVQKYGKDTAFYCTNAAETEPLIKQIMKYGGLFPEAEAPSPTFGYPGALGIDLKAEQGDWPAILKKVEQAVIDVGGSGRFGTYPYSYLYSVSAGLGEYAKRCVEGTAKLQNNADLFDALGKYTLGAAWNGSNYKDLNSGKTFPNYALNYMDTYVFGKGYLGTTKLVVPEKYLTFKPPAS